MADASAARRRPASRASRARAVGWPRVSDGRRPGGDLPRSRAAGPPGDPDLCGAGRIRRLQHHRSALRAPYSAVGRPTRACAARRGRPLDGCLDVRE